MSRIPLGETPAQARLREVTEATAEVLGDLQSEFGLSMAAIAVDGILEGVFRHLTEHVGRDAALLMLRNTVDAMTRRAPAPRIVSET